MGLFTWDGPSYCGDEPATVCDPLVAEESVKALHGTSFNGGCAVDLISPEYPAIPVVISSILAEPRSGSAAHPIPIGLVQESESMFAPTLMFRDNSGNLNVWKPDASCKGKRMTFDAGSFRLKDDENSNVFDQDCVGSFADCEYIVGARSFVDCEGNSKMKLVFFPVSELPVPA